LSGSRRWAWALLLGGLGCPAPPAPPPPPPLPSVFPLAPAEVEDVARRALDEVSALRGLPIGDPPTIRILPPAAFAAERDAMAGTAAGGSWGDDMLVGLRALAGLGLAAADQLTTRGAGGSEVGTYDCEEDIIRVADLSFLPPPAELLDESGEAPPGWRALSVSLHGLLAHEALHALVRRAFPLTCPARRTWPDRDGELALRALEEGDADLVLADVVAQRATTDAPDLALWTTSLLDADLAEPLVGFDYLAAFPYVAGVELARALERAGGNAARDEAYGRPPVSSAQVLHPELYFAGRLPVQVNLPDFPALREQGYSAVETGTVGEAGLVAFLTAPSPGAQILLADVVPVPAELCDPPPQDCSGLTELPGGSPLPPGMTTGLSLSAPAFPPDLLPPPPEGMPAPDDAGSTPPAPVTENWSLRDEQGRVRAAAWSRIGMAAAGWRGDTIAFWLRPDQDVPAVLWSSVWADACAAERFRREVTVARPPWAVCRKGERVHVVGGLRNEDGAGALRALVERTVAEDRSAEPFPRPWSPPPGRLEERAVAELGAVAQDGWPALGDVAYSPQGPTVLRRFVDEEVPIVLPLPAGPYWAVLPAVLRSPLARGVALERVGGGRLVVGVVAAAVAPQLEVRLAQRHGELADAMCALGPSRGATGEEDEPGAGAVIRRVLLVEAGDRALLLEGSLPAGAATASREEFAAAFAAACGVP
jgi:hypothetical protein